MRGISGSGKSTYVKTFCDTHMNCAVVSADLFFMKEGVYNFDPTLLGQAHLSCMNSFIKHLTENKVDYLIVDNTNTRNKEITPYIKAASVFPSVKFNIVVIKTDPQIAFKRNQHKVPLEVIEKMNARLEQNLKNPIPEGWPTPTFINY